VDTHFIGAAKSHDVAISPFDFAIGFIGQTVIPPARSISAERKAVIPQDLFAQHQILRI
jgi:hypothetical protein